MRALNEAWRSVCRFMGRTNTPDPRTTSSTGVVDLFNDVPQAVRSCSRQLHLFYERFREEMQGAQRYREMTWQDAVREDRRANRRALILLTKLLNPEQRQEFRKSGHFQVIGGSTGDRYRIRAGMIANIDVLRDDGTVKYRLCVLPTGGVPVYDVMAAQLLHLQDPDSEPRMLQQANVYLARPGGRVF